LLSALISVKEKKPESKGTEEDEEDNDEDKKKKKKKFVNICADFVRAFVGRLVRGP
jgi:hypothetical protein